MFMTAASPASSNGGCPTATTRPGQWLFGPELTVEEYRKLVAMRLEAIDVATRDIPADRIRLHLCWGNAEWPHHMATPYGHCVGPFH